MSKSHSRRAILAGIAAAPVAAVPALAVASETKPRILGATPDTDDPKAALARLEQVIDILRTRHVRDGWHDGGGLDEAAAARALAYFRAGCPEETDQDFVERDAATDFIFSHGQSLDWIIDGDPVGLICRAAKHSARAQSLGGTDPIFTAIERHKTAYRLSQEAGRIRSGTIDSESDPEYDPVKCPAIIEASEAADEDADDAAHALTTVRPTTMAGVLALIRHVEAFNAGAFFLEPLPDDTMIHWQSKPFHWPADIDEDNIDVFGFAVLANVRCALEAMAGVS